MNDLEFLLCNGYEVRIKAAYKFSFAHAKDPDPIRPTYVMQIGTFGTHALDDGNEMPIFPAECHMVIPDSGAFEWPTDFLHQVRLVAEEDIRMDNNPQKP